MMVSRDMLRDILCNVTSTNLSDFSCTDLLNNSYAWNSINGLDRSPPSQAEIQESLERLTKGNFDQVTQTFLILAFAVLILFGAAGNGLVCFVVARNQNMRTPRNIFIINLAISDLTLCLFTQPFNLLKVSLPFWNLGNFTCKFVPMFAGTNVFVSTISITAIALDRFQVIVYPTKDSMKKVGAAVALLSIWIISLMMASPLLIFNVKKELDFHNGLVLTLCTENAQLHYEKGAYSIASMIFQYIVPILIVSVAHARICNKLKYRMVNRQNPAATNYNKKKSAKESKRKRKTNILLSMIGCVFAISWLPLNAFNIIADFNYVFLKNIDKRGLVFPICHLLVLSSACTNPVLYGWLNENFRKEFVKVLCCSCQKDAKFVCSRCCVPEDRDRGNMLYSRTSLGPNSNYEMGQRSNQHLDQLMLAPDGRSSTYTLDTPSQH